MTDHTPDAFKSADHVGVDLDGTLAKYHGWKGHKHIGEPVPKMLERVKKMLADKQKVVIFTARADAGETAIKHIKLWCKKHVGKILPVTNVKDRHMTKIIDDKAEGIVHNTGETKKGQAQPTAPEYPWYIPDFKVKPDLVRGMHGPGTTTGAVARIYEDLGPVKKRLARPYYQTFTNAFSRLNKPIQQKADAASSAVIANTQGQDSVSVKHEYSKLIKPFQQYAPALLKPEFTDAISSNNPDAAVQAAQGPGITVGGRVRVKPIPAPTPKPVAKPVEKYPVKSWPAKGAPNGNS